MPYVEKKCPKCKRIGKLYVQHNERGWWLACPACEWTQDGFHASTAEAYEKFEWAPPPPAPATKTRDHLRDAIVAMATVEAMSAQGYNTQGQIAYASALAAVAQAEVLTRIARTLDKILDEMANPSARD
jgi:hypothetical protein